MSESFNSKLYSVQLTTSAITFQSCVVAADMTTSNQR